MDMRAMNSVLVEMVEKLAYRLRQENKLTACITIKIRYANYDTQTMQKRIPYTAFDHHILEVAKELFRKLYTRRMLIRLIGVKFTRLVQGTQQLNLFEDTRRVVYLYQTMDRIRNMYGKHSIGRASGKNFFSAGI